jgi:DNA modification methylase
MSAASSGPEPLSTPHELPESGPCRTGCATIALMPGQLYYGDNLKWLRSGEDAFRDGSVDLIYLDPPFKSQRLYNVFLREAGGSESSAQAQAFDDTWEWNPETRRLFDWLTGPENRQRLPELVPGTFLALHEVLKTKPMMAYLVWMGVRLVELHRKLKSTGSLYLHCDSTASHYLKLVLDSIFGSQFFRNEIIWRRTGAHNKVSRYAPIHDSILFYTKSDKYTWNTPKQPYMRGHVEQYFVHDEKGWRTNYYGNVLTGSGLRGGESGKPWRGVDPSKSERHWAVPGALVEDLDEDLSDLGQHEKLDRLVELGFIKFTPGEKWPMYERYITERDGQAMPDLWTYQPYTAGTVFGTEDAIDADVRWLRGGERQGFPTEKPVGLLDRILRASSNDGDVILDPFCGCGTTIQAAESLGRNWIGIDVTHLAIGIIRNRLNTAFDGKVVYQVHGEPEDIESARLLAEEDKYEFQWWAVDKLGGVPYGAASGTRKGKKGADSGVDGYIFFRHDPKAPKPGKIVISVKAGKIKPEYVRELAGTLTAEKADIGVLVSVDEPTSAMHVAAATYEPFRSATFEPDKSYDRIQLLTAEDILAGKRVQFPGQNRSRYSAPPAPPPPAHIERPKLPVLEAYLEARR